MFQDFSLRSTTATFVYLPHFAVVRTLKRPSRVPRAACRAGTRATPPPKTGGHVTLIAVLSSIPLSRPHGVALVLIYPCGKAWKNSPFPSRFIVSDRSSPSRVRFAASRPGRLRADPKDALLTRGKGGAGRGARGRVASPLAHDKGYYHSYCAAKPKASFRPYQTPEPQPRGAVTRRGRSAA